MYVSWCSYARKRYFATANIRKAFNLSWTECIKAQEIPLLRTRSDYVYLCGRSFVFTNCMHNMLTRIQEIIASSSPLRQCFGVPHALASDANIPWRADDLLSAESACARTSRRFMIDGCTVPLCEYVTLPCGRPEMELGMNAISTEFARQSHWTITLLRNARVTFVHSSRFPGNRLSQFSIGGIPIKKPSPSLIVYDAELITNIATRTCIWYRCEKISFFLLRKEPRCTCEL